MHEYSVAYEIVALVKQTAKGARVVKITISVGALSGIFTESLLMYLEFAFPEAGMDNVSVETIDVPAQFECSCGKRYSADRISSACPLCGGYERTVVAGQECMVDSIEVDDD